MSITIIVILMSAIIQAVSLEAYLKSKDIDYFHTDGYFLSKASFDSNLISASRSILTSIQALKPSDDSSIKTFLNSYKTLITETPSFIVDKLKLTLDDNLPKRVWHLFAVASASISDFSAYSDEKELEGVTFDVVESFESAKGLRTSLDVDLLSSSEDLVADVTADASLIPSKLSSLKAKFPNVATHKVLVLKENPIRKVSIKAVLKRVAEVITPPSFSVANEYAFSSEKDREEIMSILKTSYEAAANLKQLIFNEDPKRVKGAVDEVLYREMINKNSSRALKIFEEEFKGSIEYKAAIDIITSSTKKAMRPLIRAEPTVSISKVADFETYEAPIDEFIHTVADSTEIGKCYSVTLNDDGSLNFAEEKRDLVGTKRLEYLTSEDERLAIVTRVSDKCFKIRFNIDTFLIDRHMKDSLTRNDHAFTPEERAAMKLDYHMSASKPISSIDELIEDYENFSQGLHQIVGADSPIFSRAMEVTEKVSANKNALSLLSCFHSDFRKMMGSRLVASTAHEYEIAKSVSASLKSSPDLNLYFLSQNGSLASKSLIQVNSSVESFSNVFAVTSSFSCSSNSYKTSKSVSFNRNTLDWALRKPFAMLAATEWAYEEDIKEALKNGPDFSTMKFLMELIACNRDPFAQAADQARYMTMSSISYGSSLNPSLEKLKEIEYMSYTEIMYVVRLIKTSAALERCKAVGKSEYYLTKDKKDLSIVMPHERNSHVSFSHLISSMYVNRLYNRVKSFLFASENEIMRGVFEEIDIWENTDKRSEVFSGVWEVEEITKSISKCMNEEPSRYKNNVYGILAGTLRAEVAKPLRDDLFESDISKFMSTKASMSGDKVKMEAQSSKSFASTAEALMDMADLSSNKFLTLKTYYLWASSLADIFEKKKEFCSYLVGKLNQVGNREIYVMNFNMRLGTFLVEETARAFSREHEINVQNSEKRDEIFQAAIRDAREVLKNNSEDASIINDNADAKRWGPNQRMDSMASVLAAIVPSDEPDVYLLCAASFALMTEKKVKFPQSLIKAAMKKVEFSEGTRKREVQSKINSMVSEGICYVIEEVGMGQGIFQEFSSVLHGAKQFCEIEAIKEVFGRNLLFAKALVTSDDSYKALVFSSRGPIAGTNAISLLSRIEMMIGNIFGTLRNKAKSSYNMYIAEFNSKFYSKSRPAVPTLKFKVSKIEVASGQDLFEDALFAIDAGSEFLSQGGSYIGALQTSAMAYCLFLEQWRITPFFFKISSDPSSKMLSSAGLFRIIEPVSICVNGSFSFAVSHDLFECYEETQKKPLSAAIEKISAALVDCLTMDLKLVRFEAMRKREGLEPNSVDLDSESIEMKYTSFYSGFFGFTRAPRSASLMKTVGRNLMRMKDSMTFTLFNKARNLSEYLGKLEVSVGFDRKSEMGYDSYIRFSDPWVNKEKAIFHRTEGDFLSRLFSKEELPEDFSLDTLTKVYSSFSHEMHIRYHLCFSTFIAKEKKMLREASYVFSSWLSANINCMRALKKSESEHSNFNEVTEEGMLPMKVRPDAIKIMREDDFKAAFVKSTAGEDSINLIKSRFSSYEEVATIPGLPALSLKESMLMITSVTSKISFLKPASKTFWANSDIEGLSSTQILNYLLKLRFASGVGLSANKGVRALAVDSVISSESLMEDDGEMYSSLSKIVDAHYAEILFSGSSDFEIIKEKVMSDEVRELSNKLLRLSRNDKVGKSLYLAACSSLLSRISFRLSPVEVFMVFDREMAAAGRTVFKGRETFWKYTSRITCKKTEVVGHCIIESSAGEKTYTHVIGLQSMATVDDRTVLTLRKAGSEEIEGDFTLGQLRAGIGSDRFKFIDCSKAREARVLMSETSLVLGIEIASEILPLTTMALSRNFSDTVTKNLTTVLDSGIEISEEERIEETQRMVNQMTDWHSLKNSERKEALKTKKSYLSTIAVNADVEQAKMKRKLRLAKKKREIKVSEVVALETLVDRSFRAPSWMMSSSLNTCPYAKTRLPEADRIDELVSLSTAVRVGASSSDLAIPYDIMDMDFEALMAASDEKHSDSKEVDIVLTDDEETTDPLLGEHDALKFEMLSLFAAGETKESRAADAKMRVQSKLNFVRDRTNQLIIHKAIWELVWSTAEESGMESIFVRGVKKAKSPTYWFAMVNNLAQIGFMKGEVETIAKYLSVSLLMP